MVSEGFQRGLKPCGFRGAEGFETVWFQRGETFLFPQTVWPHYGVLTVYSRKASGVNRWCAHPFPDFVSTLSVKSSLEIEKMYFACARRGLCEVHFGGAFSPARRVDFRKSANVQNVRVLRGV